MRFTMMSRFIAFGFVLSALVSSPPAAAQVEPTADAAITCALVYAYLGDRGSAYEQLVTTAAETGKRTVGEVRADLAERAPRLAAGVADGRLEVSSLDRMGDDICPKTFGVAAAKRGTATVASASSNTLPRPDPLQCAGIYRWLDARYPSNTWGTTWAGDEMVRRAAGAAGLSYAEMDRRAGSFSPSTAATAAQLDLAVQCQTEFDTPVPPGAVLAAAKFGDRPGIARGRVNYCTALGNDYDKNFPDISSIEQAIANNPQSAGDRVLQLMNSLNWYLGAMEKADCPADIAEPRFAAFQELTSRSTRAVQQAKQRLEREGPWW